MADLSMLAVLAQRAPQLLAQLAASRGIDLASMAGGQWQDMMQGGSIGDVLTGGPDAGAPPVIPPILPPGRPVPKPEGAPTGPADTEAAMAEAAKMAAQRQQALSGLGQTLLGGQAAPQPRAPAAPLELSRGLSNTGGIEALLGIANQAPHGSIPLSALLRGIS